MQTILQKVESLGHLTRQLQKMESKMRAGQWIDAWRECNRLIAECEKEKRRLLAGAEEKQPNGEVNAE